MKILLLGKIVNDKLLELLTYKSGFDFIDDENRKDIDSIFAFYDGLIDEISIKSYCDNLLKFAGKAVHLIMPLFKIEDDNVSLFNCYGKKNNIKIIDFGNIYGILNSSYKNAYYDDFKLNDKGYLLLSDLLINYFVENGFTHYSKSLTIQNILDDKELSPYSKYLFYNWGKQTYKNVVIDINVMTFNGINRYYEMIKKGFVNIYYLEDSIKLGRRDVNIVHLKQNKKAKAAFVIAGGGYTSVCVAMESLPIGQYLFDRGYHVFLLTYGVAELAANNGPVIDLANAIKYVQLHQDELNVDFNDYALIGSSAGGYLLAQFGTYNHGYKTFSLPKPGAMALQYPVSDIATASDYFLKACLSDKYKNDIAIQNEYASSKHIDKDYPATFIVGSSHDGVVDEINFYILDKQLSKHNIKHSLVIYPYTGHGWGKGYNPFFDGWLDNFISFWQSCYKED